MRTKIAPPLIWCYTTHTVQRCTCWGSVDPTYWHFQHSKSHSQLKEWVTFNSGAPISPNIIIHHKHLPKQLDNLSNCSMCKHVPSTPVIHSEAVRHSCPLMFTAWTSFTTTSPSGTPASADRKWPNSNLIRKTKNALNYTVFTCALPFIPCPLHSMIYYIVR